MKHIFFKLATAMAAALAAASCCNSGKESIDVVPYPNNVSLHCGNFQAAGANFYCAPQVSDESKAAIYDFFGNLSALSCQENKALENQGNGFSFLYDGSLAAEAYTIDVRKKKVTVKASTDNGFRYALQTIRQMLPVEIFGKTPAPEAAWTLQCASIEDSPRFRYRGMHLDVSRHFFSTDEVKKYIDMMAIHKMNTLHWHLTDDQGWRIEIKKYPLLTEVGSVRKGTVVKKNWDEYDGIPYGGFYTQEEIRDVVRYAEAKGITIIPEIDLPGHMLAALTAYPSLGCTGGPYDVWGRWGVADDVLCVGKEETFTFLENVLDEVLELFPSEYIHIGGDECPKARWEKCPVCQAKIKELGLKDDANFNAEHYLQSYVTARMEDFLGSRGRKIIGWDEILEGELSPNATVMSWRGSEGGIAAAKAGHDAIMTPTSHFYLDYYQSLDTENEPFGIGGYVPVEKVYSYEPYIDEMDDEARSHILGVQANMWTEYIASDEHLEYMMLPRASALAEVQWTLPGNKNWERFLGSLSHMADIYTAMGYNYAKTVFEVISEIYVNHDKNCVEMKLSTQGDAPIRYTLDGTEPTENSILYTAPIEIREGCTVKAKVFRSNMETRTIVKEFNDNKAMGRPVSMSSEPLPKYRYGAPESLVDGIKGTFSYATGLWAGWKGTPIDVTIEMDGKTAYSSVTLSTLVQKGEDIFNPLDLVVSVSDDNVTFAEVGRAEYPAEGQDVPDGLKEYTVTFPETSAKYIRVSSTTVESIPEWHYAHGREGFTFIDEIFVR
ncbi:MAG: family 20 glycosylhydrolase [Bacteroidales bacterium]|nr:family 20 glycosylhydrolase [Bacteroidales bacterium]